jgi:serine/threonine protein kinase
MIGTKIGHLLIESKLGSGGMGAVYCAQHEVLRKVVVVKVLLPQWTQNELTVKRFINEARAAAKIPDLLTYPSVELSGSQAVTA